MIYVRWSRVSCEALMQTTSTTSEHYSDKASAAWLSSWGWRRQNLRSKRCQTTECSKHRWLVHIGTQPDHKKGKARKRKDKQNFLSPEVNLPLAPTAASHGWSDSVSWALALPSQIVRLSMTLRRWPVQSRWSKPAQASTLITFKAKITLSLSWREVSTLLKCPGTSVQWPCFTSLWLRLLCGPGRQRHPIWETRKPNKAGGQSALGAWMVQSDPLSRQLSTFQWGNQKPPLPRHHPASRRAEKFWNFMSLAHLHSFGETIDMLASFTADSASAKGLYSLPCRMTCKFCV